MMRAFLPFCAVLSVLMCSITGRAQVVYHQVYRLTSLEGKPVRISLSYKLWSRRLAIACAGDTLFLHDYQGTESVRVLQHRFLQINYYTRCGSDCATQNTAFVAADQQKPLLSLLVGSSVESVSWPNYDWTYHYHVTFTMTNGTSNDYTLQAKVREEEVFQKKPNQNHKLNQLVTLRWDAARQIFYSAFEPTARCLPVYDEATRNPFKPGDLSALNLVQPEVYIPYYPVAPQWVVGTFPVIRLGSNLYYFIQNNWYTGPAKPKQDEFYWFVKNEIEYVPSRGNR